MFVVVAVDVVIDPLDPVDDLVTRDSTTLPWEVGLEVCPAPLQPAINVPTTTSPQMAAAARPVPVRASMNEDERSSGAGGRRVPRDTCNSLFYELGFGLWNENASRLRITVNWSTD